LHETGDLEQIFRDLVSVADTTYQRALGAAFSDTEEGRALVRLSLAHGWFRAWVLYRRDEPIAFWQGTVYNRVYMSGIPGYKPEYRPYRVGIYLLMKVIEDLCADPNVDFLDYGPGDADYKRQFSSENWEERDVVVFAPTLRSVRINTVRTVILAGAKVAKATVERVGIADRIKAGWRQRLAADQDKSSG
jgi:CelD/BcsL family acetyltransferase involved in cellulose biosynthesis